MLLATCASLALGTLPLPGGLPGGSLPLPSGGSGRPGPPNKGLVRWGMGVPRPIHVEEVDTKDMVSTPEQQWTNIPDWLHWSTAHMTGYGAAGESLVLECPADSGDNLPCTFYVTFYECVPCSSEINGGLPSALSSAEFTAGSCGPRYTPTIPDTDPEKYPTVIYRLTVPSGAAPIELPITKELLHVAVFELSIGQQCWLKGSVGCQESESCVWVSEMEHCMDKPICPPKPLGPQPPQGKKCECISFP